MANLAQYLDVDGYRLDITSQLATTLAEATTTFSLGNQTDSTVPGTVTASGVAQFYAITDGADIIEAGALVTGQPVVVDFGFTIANFETAPKIIPQGHDGQGSVQKSRSRKRKDTKPEEYAGRKLNKAIEEALAPPPAPEPEPVIEVTVEPTPVLLEPEAPQPPAQAEVVPASEPVISLRSIPRDMLEAGRSLAETRAALVEAFMARVQANKPVLVQDPEPQDTFDPAQDEADALEAMDALMFALADDMDEAA
jgi:hypothetical protein